MLSTLKNVIIPANSRRGRYMRDSIARIRTHRRTAARKASYNLARQEYYSHATTKISNNQSKKISIIVPCYNTPAKYFEPLLASIFAQGYSNWELVLVDASDNKSSSKYLKEKALADTRIKYVETINEGIAGNTNKGISEAEGELIAFLDHDDALDHDALAESAEIFINYPKTGLVYSDEDKISDDGERYFEPHFKPDFSLDMLRNVNYITHFVVVRKSIVDSLKGIREGFDGAQDYDFLLRVVDKGTEIRHVPKILYHWREAEGSTAADFSNKKHVTDAGCRALIDHYSRRNIQNVEVKAIENRPGFYKTIYLLDSTERTIYINLESQNITDLEKEYILNCYKKNVDVQKYNITVVEGTPNKKTGYEMVVNGCFIPEDRTTDIASLFGIGSEKDVAGVSPKIVRHGRIYDFGIVFEGTTPKYLFRGLNPDREMCFGSLEWVRNVNKLSSNVSVCRDHAENNSRHIVWAHSQFIALKPDTSGKSKEPSFYNPNLEELTELIEKKEDYIADFVEVKK